MQSRVIVGVETMGLTPVPAADESDPAIERDGEGLVERDEYSRADDFRSSSDYDGGSSERRSAPLPERAYLREPDRHPIHIDERRIDPDAAKVVRRLVRYGYEAYLVGGCVRDLLLDQSPKDFDVCTNARPEDVRALFRNSRVIGRRFRLVHIIFSRGKVIETATFRRTPSEEERTEELGAAPRGDGQDLLIRNDNLFGCADEDAMRRDFTINALFYDLEHKEVLDWCGGMQDIERRTVRTIGNPVTRFLEDPVRILRAIKFSARLDLGLDPEVYHSIVQCRGSLAMAARPRVFEELLRLMRGGAAQRSIWLMWETGVLDVLLPELSAYLADRDPDDTTAWRVLIEVDRATRERGEPLDDVVLWSAILLEPLLEACAGEKDWGAAAMEFLEPIVERLNVPRRISDAVRRIIGSLPRLEAGKPGRFSRTVIYPLAVQIFEMRRLARPEPTMFSSRPRRRKRRRLPTEH